MDKTYLSTNLKLVADVDPPKKAQTQEWEEIRRNRLINSLNRINFQDGDIVLNFRHLQYDKLVSVSAKPQPCLDHNFSCRWAESFDLDNSVDQYRFENFFFTDGLKQVLVAAEIISIDKDGVNFCLPESAVVINTRKVKRLKCSDVPVRLVQKGRHFEGEVDTFSPASFSINIPDEIPINYKQVIQREEPVEIIIQKNDEQFFVGNCKILRLSQSSIGRILILKPLNNQIQRYKSKQFRSIRQELRPSPNISFWHPLITKRVNLTICDISGSGFSVEESYDNSLLLPGLIIPDLKIELTNGLAIQCKCQVIYRTQLDDETVKCGFAFVDMSIKNQIRLTSFLLQASNKNAHVCTKINIDDLWDFFFKTGFIYPQKYFYIHANKNKFVEVYKKLYEQDSDIAINFTYQDKGVIYGHMSMFRFYDRTWIIHHHAADSSKRSMAGLVVLEQIGRYINEFHRLPSTHMEYVGCYFRPDNKFPNLVFGGAARTLSAGCSVDEFAYMYLSKKNLNNNLPRSWKLLPADKQDLTRLIDFYENYHKGLTLKALDIDTAQSDADKSINHDFHSYGFKRERFLYSLKNENKLIAVFMVCVTELGLNLSDLTNCIHGFVLDPDNLPNKILHSAVSCLSSHYEHENLSVLLFPKDYCEAEHINYNKIYKFWVLDIEKTSDEYSKYMEKLINRVRK